MSTRTLSKRRQIWVVCKLQANDKTLTVRAFTVVVVVVVVAVAVAVAVAVVVAVPRLICSLLLVCLVPWKRSTPALKVQSECMTRCTALR